MTKYNSSNIMQSSALQTSTLNYHDVIMMLLNTGTAPNVKLVFS